MIFAATTEDVKILIRKKGESLPTIKSVLITDGSLPIGEARKQEHCEYECGVRGEAVPTILGGREAPEGAWPWNVGN